MKYFKRTEKDHVQLKILADLNPQWLQLILSSFLLLMIPQTFTPEVLCFPTPATSDSVHRSVILYYP